MYMLRIVYHTQSCDIRKCKIQYIEYENFKSSFGLHIHTLNTNQ